MLGNCSLPYSGGVKCVCFGLKSQQGEKNSGNCLDGYLKDRNEIHVNGDLYVASLHEQKIHLIRMICHRKFFRYIGL